MDIEDLKKNKDKFQGKIYFDYDIRKLNWFNIGGSSRIFFRPENLEDLIFFKFLQRQRKDIYNRCRF